MRECQQTFVKCILAEAERLLKDAAEVSIYYRQHFTFAIDVLTRSLEGDDIEIIGKTSKDLLDKAVSLCGRMPKAKEDKLYPEKKTELMKDCVQKVVGFCNSLKGDSIRKVITMTILCIYTV